MKTAMKQVTAPIAVLAATALFALGAAEAGNYEKMTAHDEPAKKDIVATAVAAGQFQTLATALQAAGLIDTLQGEGPFTVFAPTDAAFAKLPEGTVETLLKPENRDKLVAVLTYHVVPGAVSSKDVAKLSNAETVNGGMLNIDVVNGNVRVDNATVIKTDIAASNGVIHVIDTVVIPNS